MLYGRRRVGKTELLRAFCEGKPHVFFVADLGTEVTALANFTREISSFLYGRPDALGSFPSWVAAFEFLARHAAERRLVVILDEFTYLVQVNPALLSMLQRLWDQLLQKTRIMLVLCGSYASMMEREVLAYRAPLYGRRTAQWQLQPLPFLDARLFLPRWSPVDQVRAYAILGGTPAYLLQFSDRMSLLDNYFRFWFRFVYPGRSLLVRGQTRQVREKIADQLDEFTGLPFEAICREHVWRLHDEGKLGFVPRAVGSWWNDRDQIDVVAVGDRDIFMGECKWAIRPVGATILHDLRRKAQVVLAGGDWQKAQYAVFSRSGFAPDLEAQASAEDVRLIDLGQICG